MTPVLVALAATALSVTTARSASSETRRIAMAARGSVVSTNVIAHGMRITMVIPLIQPLWRSSLLRLGVRVTNVSSGGLQLTRPCDRSNPRTVVTNGSGIVVYDTVRTWPVAQRCVARPPTRLAPGQSLERQNYVVLRGPVVQPVVDVLEGNHSVRVAGKGYRLAVRPQYLTPHATALFVGGGHMPIRGGRGNVPLYKRRRLAAVEVESRGPAIGPLVAIGSALCSGRPVLLPNWTVISGAHRVARIPAPCPRPRLWLVDYGWVGQSVGEVLVGTGNLRPTTG